MADDAPNPDISLPLDELIKRDKSKRPAKTPKAATGGPGSAGKSGGRGRGAAAAGRPSRGMGGRGGGGRGRSSAVAYVQSDDYDGYRQPRYAQAPVVYQAAPMVVPAAAPAPARPAALSTAGLSGKLYISNLDGGVTTDDIEELFSKFGEIRSAWVHFDKDGNSRGTAQVTYKKRKSAQDAVQQYNGVALDGKPMKIEFITPELPEQPVEKQPQQLPVQQTYQVVLPGAVASTGGVRRERDYDDYTSRREERPPRREHFAPRQEGGRGGGRGRGDGGGRGRGRGDGPKKEKTAEELDGEMDSYFKKK